MRFPWDPDIFLYLSFRKDNTVATSRLDTLFFRMA